MAMRFFLPVMLVLAATTPLGAQETTPYTSQLAATVSLSQAVVPRADSAPSVSPAARAGHRERTILGGATAGALFALIVTLGPTLYYRTSPQALLDYTAPRVALGAGLGALLGLALSALPPPPCGCE
jgi:hypothetical protein